MIRRPLRPSRPSRPSTHAGRPVRLVAVALLGLVVVLAGCGGPGAVASPAKDDPAPSTGGPPPLLLRDVTLLDLRGGRLVPGRSLLLEGGRVAAVGAAGELSAPAGARVLAGDGAVVLPGLWDLHVHDLERPGVLAGLLDHGVTSVRAMGGPARDQLTLRDDLARGARDGPRLVTAGPWVDGPWTAGTPDPAERWIVADGAQVRAAVGRLADLGVDLVKVHDRLSLPALEALAAACAEGGLAWAGHVPRGLTPEQVVALGPVSLEHAAPLAERLLTREALTSDAAFDQLLEAWAAGEGADLARAMVAGDVGLVPTLVASEALTAAATGAAWDDPRSAGVPATLREDWRASIPTADQWPGFADQRRAVDRAARRVVVELAARGVRLGAGSDLGAPHVHPGSGLHDELAALGGAGLSPLAVLRAATWDAAILAGRGGRSGLVEPGRDADLLLVRGDPLTDPDVLRTPRAVILGGRLVRGG